MELLSRWKTYTNACEFPNVIQITEGPPLFALTAAQHLREKIISAIETTA
jgi:hypothetical protein